MANKYTIDGYDATREIRKHWDPAVRNVLVIAMTASAIQGDREKCLEAGMNNYLAKPVRVHTLKTLLETYLFQHPKQIPNLQEEANRMAKDVLEKAGTLPDEAAAAVASSIARSDVPIRPQLNHCQGEGHSRGNSNITVVQSGTD
jgi:CheY-like chemotaxis protein